MMKIRKYQIGGLSYKPIYRPEYNNPAESPEGSKQDDLLTSLAGKGLVNDFNAVADLYYLAQTQGVDMFTGQMSTKYLVELSKAVNAMQTNYEAYKTAVTHIETEDSGHDVAITKSGWLYAFNVNTSELESISPEQYYTNSDKYQLMTNADMLEIRNIYPGKAFDTSILTDLGSSFSMKSVTNYLLDIINKFGTYTEKMKEEGYSEADIEAINAGIRFMKESESISQSFEGYNQFATEEDIFHLNSAVNYLWSQLTPGMKKTFIAHVAAEGYNPTDQNTIYSLLGTMIVENTTHTYSYGNGVNGGRSGRAGSSSYSTGNTPISIGALYFNNISQMRLMPISGQKSNQYLMVPGYDVPILEDIDKSVPASKEQELASSRYSDNRRLGLINTSLPVYFGSNPVTLEQLEGIGIDLVKGSQLVYLPQTRDGRINWALLREVNNLLKAVYQREDFAQMNQAQQDQVLSRLVDNPSNDLQGVTYNTQTHQIEYANTKAYITYYGLTSSANDVIGRDTANKWTQSEYLVETDDDYAERFDENWNNNKDLPELDFQSDGFDITLNGLIFMPVSEDDTRYRIQDNLVTSGKLSGAYIGARNQFYGESNLYNPTLGISTIPGDIGYNFNDLN